jgi:hypothetical protein
MTTLLSIDRFLPPYRYTQDVVTDWVRSWLDENDKDNATRLLSVYASAGVTGQRLGRDVARFVVQNFLTPPRREDDGAADR